MTGYDWKEYWACLALRHTHGVGPRTCARLVADYGSALAAAMDAAEHPNAWVGRGLAREAQAAAFHSQAWREPALDEWREVRARGCAIVLWAQAEYPQHLRRIPDPPIILYAKGSLSLMANAGVAVVGSRTCTKQGLLAASNIGRGLSRAGVTVVSGLAYGIDREAHLAALTGPGSSIAVLGAGLDADYPAGNHDLRAELEDKGLVLTELKPSAGPEPRNFPVRNRIISGLSLGVVVVEAAERSGALITAKYALEQDREVFAVSGPGGSASHEGCHRLINEGARLVGSAEEVLAELLPHLDHQLKDQAASWHEDNILASQALPEEPDLDWGRAAHFARKKPAPQARPQEPRRPAARAAAAPLDLSGDESDIMAALHGQAQVHIDALGQVLGWDAGRISRVLVQLEVRGLVRQWPGMLYGAN